MQKKKQQIQAALGRRWIPYTVATCSAVVLYLVLAHLLGIWSFIQGLFAFISPVFWGAIIAYIIDALVRVYERTLFRRTKLRKTARHASIVLALLSIILVLVLFFIALIPQLVSSISGLIANLNGYASSLTELLESATWEIAGYQIDLSELAKYGSTLLTNLTTIIQDNIGRIINTSYTIGKGFVNTVITFILSIYFLLEKDKLLSLMRSILRHKLTGEKYTRTVDFLRRCNYILIRFITCDLLDGLIVGVANFIFMKITGMPYSVLISVVVAFANLVPTFGPIAGGAIGAFILLLVHPQYVLWFLIFTVVLQTIDGYILKPKLYGDSLGISSLWVLIAVIVGGRMFGTAGLILGIPFAAISDFLFRDLYWRRNHSENNPPAAGISDDSPPEG